MIMSIRWKKILLAISLVLSLGLVGCGGSSGGDSASANSTEGPLDPSQNLIGNLLGGELFGTLANPLGGVVSCTSNSIVALVDTPDALLATFESLPLGADPLSAFNGAAPDVSANLLRFAGALQSVLMMLTDQTGGCDLNTVAGNPLSGTPLDAVGGPLASLISTLQLTGDGGAGGAPDLSVLTASIVPQLTQLSSAFALLPADVQGTPVMGDMFSIIQGMLGDMAPMLSSAGSYDTSATQTSMEAMLNNMLGGLLLGGLPVPGIDAVSGQNFNTQIQNVLALLPGVYGSDLTTLITPAFDSVLNGAFLSMNDPISGLIPGLLAQGTTGNPLDGLLGGLAGNGASPLDGLLALLTASVDGIPLSDLTSPLGGGTGTPLDDLLALSDPANAGELDSVLGSLSSLLGNNPLGGILGGILGGLL